MSLILGILIKVALIPEVSIFAVTGAAATAHRRLASFFKSAGGTPSALFSTYNTAEIRPTASNLKCEIHVQEYSSHSNIPLSSTQATAMQREDSSTIIMKVCHMSMENIDGVSENEKEAIPSPGEY